jgi:hypothetical protein
VKLVAPLPREVVDQFASRAEERGLALEVVSPGGAELKLRPKGRRIAPRRRATSFSVTPGYRSCTPARRQLACMPGPSLVTDMP